MSKTFKPRRRKLTGPKLSGTMKTVRIDARTVIMVSVSLSDEEARKRFYERHTSMTVPEDIAVYPKTPKECFKEIPVESLEQLPSIIDDEMLPDLE
jgi:hypothetical protein